VAPLCYFCATLPDQCPDHAWPERRILQALKSGSEPISQDIAVESRVLGLIRRKFIRPENIERDLEGPGCTARLVLTPEGEAELTRLCSLS
jgi:hypothetical protein